MVWSMSGTSKNLQPDKLRNVWNLAVYRSRRGSCNAALITRVPKLCPIKLILSYGLGEHIIVCTISSASNLRKLYVK